MGKSLQKFPITVKPLKYTTYAKVNVMSLLRFKFFFVIFLLAENRKYSLMEKLAVYE